MKILGISCYYHDAAACLLDSGRIVAAAQEERFTRKKHDAGFPTQAVKYCLAEGSVTRDGLDAVAAEFDKDAGSGLFGAGTERADFENEG